MPPQSFVSYLRSIYLHKDKSIFKLEGLPVDRYAESLGLPGTPKIKFFSRELAKQKKNASREVQAIEKDDEASSEEEEGSESEGEDSKGNEEDAKGVQDAKGEVVRTKYDRMFGRKNQNVLSAHYTKLIDHDGFGNENDPDEEDFITLKRVDHDLPDSVPPIDPNDASELSKRKLKMSKTKRQIAKSGSNKKLIFDDEGNPHELYELADGKEWIEGQGGLEGVQQEGRKFAEEERSKKEVTDVLDKAQAKAKKQEKKRKRKERENMLAGDMGAGGAATLGGVSDDDDGYQSPEFDLPSGSDSEDEAATFEEYQQKRDNTQMQSPPAKKRKTDHALEDEEELALQLLRRR